MTEEVDPRLVALGLVPAPPGWREQQQQALAESAAPMQSSTATVPNPFAEPSTSTPSAPGELFAGMGKFTGMPAEVPPAEPTDPFFTTPAPAYPPPPAAEPTPLPEYTLPTHTPPVAPRAPETPIREAPP